MITKGDDFPLHQSPEPIAYSGTDPNFYDRYFFNGYSKDGRIFFAVAMGVYPHNNVIDASFCVLIDGIQYDLHASGNLGMERMNTKVGPIEVRVLEPLQSLQIIVGENEHNIQADITFHKRAAVVEEPRFTRRIGPRTLMDLTRMTQNGCYEGWIDVDDHHLELQKNSVWGTRDRSWGVRPIGTIPAEELVNLFGKQFYWLWAPLNFDDEISLYHINADETGKPWNEASVLSHTDGSAARKQAKCSSSLDFYPGTRHASHAQIRCENDQGEEVLIELKPKQHFLMRGLGYGNPDWPHGAKKGELVVGFERTALADVSSCVPPYLHIQAFVEATMTLPDGSQKHGCGVLEQYIVGPHAPSGFTESMDMAK